MLTLRLEIGHMVHIGDEATLVFAGMRDGLAELFLMRDGSCVDISMKKGESRNIGDDVRIILSRVHRKKIIMLFGAPESVSIQRSGMKKSEAVQSG